MKAYREGKLPFLDGAIIAALHWNYVPSEESNKVLAHAGAQSSVAGSAVNIRFRVKDSIKYAATGGWSSLTLRTANLAARRCTPATSLPKITTWSTPTTHLNTEREYRAGCLRAAPSLGHAIR
jgi:hypothetical protein